MTPAQNGVAAVGVITLFIVGIMLIIFACRLIGVSDYIEGWLCGAYSVAMPRLFSKLDEE